MSCIRGALFRSGRSFNKVKVDQFQSEPSYLNSAEPQDEVIIYCNKYIKIYFF